MNTNNKKLQILTRHIANRPNFLKENRESIRNIKVFDEWSYMHEILSDENPNGSGMHYANKLLADIHEENIIGDWVWILDDDDICVYGDLIKSIHLMEQTYPQAKLLLFRGDFMDHPIGRIIPSYSWFDEQFPVYGDIGMSNFIVKGDIFIEYKHLFDAPKGADYNFLKTVYNELPEESIVWCDVVIYKTVHGEGQGKAEFA